MAKMQQGPGFFDKHMEKVVLAACLLALLYAVLKFGMASKRTYEVGNRADVPLGQVDDVLLQQANSLQNRIESIPPKPLTSREDLKLLKQRQADPVSERQIALSYGVPSGEGLADRKGIDAGETPSLKDLIAAMPAPAQPLSWAGVELMLREEANAAAPLPAAGGAAQNIAIKELPTWRAVSWYPWKDLEKAWEKKLQETDILPEVIALGYEVEVEEKQADGTWKPTRDVKPVLLPVLDNTGNPVKPPAIPPLQDDNRELVRQALRDFYQNWMMVQLQPDYYPIWTRQDGPTQWTAHFPFDILKAFPEAEGEAAAGRGTGAAAPLPTPGVPTLPTSRRPIAIPAGRAAPAGAAGPTPYPAMDPRMMELDPMMMPPGMPGAGRDPRTGRYPTPARVPTRPMTPMPAVPVPAGGVTEPAEPRPEIPDLAKQFEAGKLLFWFHANGVRFGQEYRCRFRLVFVNPLLGYTQSVKEDAVEDTKVFSVKSEWSPWSKPVCVNRDVEFFVTGVNPQGNRLAVTVFTKYLDQRIKYLIGDVRPGQLIRGSQRVQVINPATNEPMKDKNGNDPTVVFDTGAIAIEFDFNKRIVTPTGVKDDGVEMVYLDSQGRLRSRVLDYDRNSSRYKKLMEEAKEAAKPFERARPAPEPKKNPVVPAGPVPGMGGPFPGGMEPTVPGRDRTRERPTRERPSRERPSRERPTRTHD